LKTAPAATFAALRTALRTMPASPEQACRDHPQVAKAMVEAHERYLASKPQAQRLFASLPALDRFAMQQLTEAVKKEFQLDIDVSNTYLFDAVGYAQRRQQGSTEPRRFVRSLMHHALQNFEASATEPGGMDVSTPAMRSVILDAGGYQNGPPFENVVNIEPTQYAALCRSLDIGGQYQALLDSIYYPAPKPSADQRPATWLDRFAAQAPVLDTLGEVELSAFLQVLHAAFLLGKISQSAYESILTTPLETLSGSPPASFAFLTLWQVELTGLVLIQFEQIPAVVLYNRHDNDSPLRQFDSFAALKTHLRNAIQQTPSLIDRHIPDAQKAMLTVKLLDHLLPLTFTLKNIYERVAASEADLPLTPRPFTRPFRAEVLYQNYTRHSDDARFHAVPTRAMDARTFHARLAYFESIALNALNLVGFVVPEVGYLLLAMNVLQLGHEVYEGIESWRNEDRQQAFNYLLDVVENIATLALVEAGGRAIKAELGAAIERETVAPQVPTPVETPSFIEELVEVEMPDGSKRLWSPDLTPYAQDTAGLAQEEPDRTGLVRHDGKTWLTLDGNTYALKWSPETGSYRLVHPSKAFSYEPPLRHNGNGAWLHALDRPRQWQGLRLFRRMGHLNASFDDIVAERILRVSGTEEGVLRLVLDESLPLPAQLRDTLQRFKLDQEVRRDLPGASPTARQAAFADRYRQLPAPQAPGAVTLRHVYPRLPIACIEELLDHASVAENRTLATGRVPRRIGDEVRLMQQQVRLTRAYEGLYLSSVDNPDSERLVLHSLTQLPGWHADTGIELRRGNLPADRVDSIGPEHGQRSIVIRTTSGYVVSADDSGRPASTHDSLYQALFTTLSQPERLALGISDAQSLAEQIEQAPLLPRWALRKALKMQRPSARSPMRLADGRLGYHLSGEGKLGAPSRASLLEALDELALAPEFTVSAERLLSAMEAAGRSPAEIQARIGQLRAERQELRASLDQAFAGPGQIVGLGARRASREDIEMALWQHWIHSAVPELDESAGTLRLSQMFIAEFPQQLPAFIHSRVSRLQLDNLSLDHSGAGSISVTQFEAQLHNVFQHFPNLAALEIERPHAAGAAPSEFANALPLIVRSFPQLGELRLINQNLTLYPLDLERFASRDTLRQLDLSGNRLAPHVTFRFPDMQLDYLGLDRMDLQNWPAWLDEAALARIGTLSLRENALNMVPAWLSANAEGPYGRCLVQLAGNPLRPAPLLEMYRSLAHLRRRFDFSFGNSRVLDEYQRLQEAVDQWAAPSSEVLPAQRRRTRNQVATSILEHWERRIREDSLTPWLLEAFSLEDFPPTLPDFFAGYVDIVRLTRVQATAEQLDQWLMRFPQITLLTLDGHIQPLQRLPTALASLPTLSRLNLRDLGLEIDEQALAILARLRAIREVDLSGNLLSLALHTWPMPRLDRLALRNMGLQAWPAWLYDAMPRFTLDLRGNQLTTLPQTVLDNPRNAYGSTALLLTENPLLPETMRTAHLSQRYDSSFTFDMDLPFDILNASPAGSGAAFGSSIGSFGSFGSTASTGSAHSHGLAPWAPRQSPDVGPWLEGSGTLQASRQALWQQLEQSNEAENLLQLFAQLTTAPPYRDTATRPALIERLWRVLGMAVDSPVQRSLYEGMALEAISEGTCPDGIVVQFKQIETQCLVETALGQASVEHREADLFRLLRRLFRQDRLDEIARERARSMREDAVEVRLSYHNQLTSTLDLLTPVDTMLFSANVTSQDATAAALQIWREEDEGEFLAYAHHWPFWTDYLREAYASDFALIESEYRTAVMLLQDDNPGSTLADLEAPTRALEEQRDQREKNLLEELTFRARAAHA